MRQIDILIIGGGPAGMSAAIAAKKEGVDSILLVERDFRLGGILNQCIHNGFGLHYFGEELTGPEYSLRLSKQVNKLGIEYLLNTTVINITPNKYITYVNKNGLETITAKAVILAMGCRERPRGAVDIAGSRPAGILTAGTAQRYVNVEGYMPGKKVIILGSGDIGLIMARRMVLEGAEVKAVCEIMPYSSGLKRNIVQCLDDYGIPLLLSHTVTRVHGSERLEGVTIMEVDSEKKPVPGTETYVECDCLLLSVGLIPENELSRSIGAELSPVTQGPVVDNGMETSIEGIFAGGNVVHVHDLVDNVTIESMKAGSKAATYVMNRDCKSPSVEIKIGKGIRYVVPQRLSANDDIETVLYMRVNNIYRNSEICIYADGKKLLRKKSRIFTPGEMVDIKIEGEILDKLRSAEQIDIKLEEREVV